LVFRNDLLKVLHIFSNVSLSVDNAIKVKVLKNNGLKQDKYKK